MALSPEILARVVVEIGEVLPVLMLGDTIYASPDILEVDSMANLEVQVAEGSTVNVDHDGSTRRDNFVLRVGIFQRLALDADMRHGRALTDLQRSIYEMKALVLEHLDGSFLDGLLVRPLALRSEDGARRTTSKSRIVKVLNFSGGVNTNMTVSGVV